MISTIIKKVAIFSFMILFSNSVFAMLVLKERLEKYTPKIILSDTKQVVAFAVGVPVVVAGSILAFNNREAISSIFENISMPEGNTALALGTIAAVPATYLYAQKKLTTKARLEAYKNWFEKSTNENLIIQNAELIHSVLNYADEKKKIELLDFINKKFAIGAHQKHPTITAVEKINELEEELIREKTILQDDKIKTNEEGKSLLESLKKLKKDIRCFRALIVGLPEYKDHINTYMNAKTVELKEQKYNFTTKWGSLNVRVIATHFTSVSGIVGSIVC